MKIQEEEIQLLAKRCPLFKNMTEGELYGCMQWSEADVVQFEKNEYIFHQGDVPGKLPVLLSGCVVIGNDTISGKRRIMTTLDTPGQIFGEVFLFLESSEYQNYAQAVKDSRVLMLPSWIFAPNAEKKLQECCSMFHEKLLYNMLSIFAGKAYHLNQTLQILSSGNLRQKLANLFCNHLGKKNKVEVQMNREEMADYLNTARPHLSRELMKMQEEGLIKIQKKEIFVKDLERLEELM